MDAILKQNFFKGTQGKEELLPGLNCFFIFTF